MVMLGWWIEPMSRASCRLPTRPLGRIRARSDSRCAQIFAAGQRRNLSGGNVGAVDGQLVDLGIDGDALVALSSIKQGLTFPLWSSATTNPPEVSALSVPICPSRDSRGYRGPNRGHHLPGSVRTPKRDASAHTLRPAKIRTSYAQPTTWLFIFVMPSHLL